MEKHPAHPNEDASKTRHCPGGLTAGRKHFLMLLLIGAVVTCIYFRTVNYDFNFDDYPNVADNTALRDIRDLRAIWSFYTPRAATYFTFALNYHFHGENPAGYRIVNIIIHAAASASLFYLVLLTLKFPAAGLKNRGKISSFTALSCALVFASHPVQTQAVTYIYQRLASMTALFYLLTLALYARASVSRKNSGLFYGAAVLCALIATFSKENAATLPAAIALYDVCFVRTAGRTLVKRLLPFAAVSLCGLWAVFFSGTVPEITHLRASMEGAPGPAPPAHHYLLTQFRVIATYLRLLILPVNQNLDYDYPLYRSLLQPPAALSLALHLAVLAAAARIFRKDRMIAFGIFFFYLALAPESSIIPVGDVQLELIFEHRLYLPAAGFAMAFVPAVIRLSGRPGKSVFFISAAVLCLAAAAYSRNFVWENIYTLWKDAASKSPLKTRALNNYGSALLNVGRVEEAKWYFLKALELDSSKDPKIFINVGTALTALNRLEEAEAYLRQALKLDPGNHSVMTNLGVVYYELGEYGRALQYHHKALELFPRAHQAYYNLGKAYEAAGDIDEAFGAYTKAAELNPRFKEAYNNRGTISALRGRYTEALADFSRVLEIDPGYAPAYLNRGWVLIQLNREAEAVSDLLKAREAGLHTAGFLLEDIMDSPPDSTPEPQGPRAPEGP